MTSRNSKQKPPILLGAKRDGFAQAIRPFRAEPAANPRHVVNAERRTQLTAQPQIAVPTRQQLDAIFTFFPITRNRSLPVPQHVFS
jgi:hypothetical protein